MLYILFQLNPLSNQFVKLSCSRKSNPFKNENERDV